MGISEKNSRVSEADEHVYLEIELDRETSAEVEATAAAENLTPFGMCVALLREALAVRNDLSTH